ncbi:anoctamin-3-like isoform X1 [Zophobas morio]|uniref:anoctamin-3-like isoform X1 n=1 Tax=Zophobas morio TaxID=2755281 RepID=UPI00308293C4
MSDERIDYVVVISKDLKQSRKFQYIIKFIKNLEELGLKLEVKHQKNKNNVYIMIHLPENVIEYFAYKYDIDIHNPGHTVVPISTINLFTGQPFQTPLSVDKDFFQREGKATTKERIQIVNKILQEVKFGTFENEFSVGKLIRYGIAKTAYPLHDGDYAQKDTHGLEIPENDRQLLLNYWGSLFLWYKNQPLNLVEKYFGSEVAFYFAWLGFYNTMLLPAAIFGLLGSVISIIYLLVVDQERVKDICESNLVMCPLCHSGKNCVYKPLNLSCHYAKISIIFDNHATVVFAVFMSFWATYFINQWTRMENTLKIRWNVDFEKMDTKARLGYRESCSQRRWSSFTGSLEPYEPTRTRIVHITLSYATSLFLIAIVLAIVFGVIMYRVAMTTIIRLTGSERLEIHGPFMLQASSACLQVVSIQLFGLFYVRLSKWLTNLENPRTQTEYDSLIAQKRYLLCFWNNYASLFYIAFVKGRFYSPNEPPSTSYSETDLCGPTGCMMNLCLQLSILMLFKSLFGNIFTLIIPLIKEKLWKSKTSQQDVPQWEKEFELIQPRRHFLVSEYTEMMVQYGFVTFFVGAFPLAPLCALINNCLELRVDAYKLLTRYRRPVPRQQSGIGVWTSILKVITHLSVATNAFVLAFTSDFVVREIYKYSHNGSLAGYIRSTLSRECYFLFTILNEVIVYDMRDYEEPLSGEPAVNPINNSTLCFYTAARHPPDHPKKYKLTPMYWYITGMRLVCVIVFEHIILLTNGVLSYVIPDVPWEVKESLHYKKNKELELKLKAHAENRARRRRTTKVTRSQNI